MDTTLGQTSLAKNSCLQLKMENERIECMNIQIRNANASLESGTRQLELVNAQVDNNFTSKSSKKFELCSDSQQLVFEDGLKDLMQICHETKNNSKTHVR